MPGRQDGGLGVGEVPGEVVRGAVEVAAARAAAPGGCAESAWSWALRRIRSTWASASLSSATRASGHAHQPRGAGQADQRDVEGEVPLVELLVGTRRRGPRRCRRASVARTWSRQLLAGHRPAADAGPLEHRPGPADVADRVGSGAATPVGSRPQALGDQHRRPRGRRPGDPERVGEGDLAQGVPDPSSPSNTARRSSWPPGRRSRSARGSGCRTAAHGLLLPVRPAAPTVCAPLRPGGTCPWWVASPRGSGGWGGRDAARRAVRPALLLLPRTARLGRSRRSPSPGWSGR